MERSKVTRGMKWTWKLKNYFCVLCFMLETYFLFRNTFAYLLPLKTENKCGLHMTMLYPFLKITTPQRNTDTHTHARARTHPFLGVS